MQQRKALKIILIRKDMKFLVTIIVVVAFIISCLVPTKIRIVTTAIITGFLKLYLRN